MENKLSSIEQVFSHIKASRNDVKYWNDSMLVDWLLEQEDRLKAMHKEEQNNKINLAINEFERLKSKAESIRDIIYLNGVLAVLDSIKNETFGGDNE